MKFKDVGLFWDDTPPPPEPPKTPPPRTWESPDYLPFLDEALRFPVQVMTDDDLIDAYNKREPLVGDVEVFPNYFLVAFRSLHTGKAIYFEMTEGGTLDRARLHWLVYNFQIVTFNGNFFDVPMIALAIGGCNCGQLATAAYRIIVEQQKAWQVLRAFKVEKIKIDHIDLIEVAPLGASLKLYGGRLHVPWIQELPFKPGSVLTANQIAIVRWYCVGSDLVNTAYLYNELREHLEIRAQMSFKYGVDLRSKSDAQVAEAVLNAELQRLTYNRPERPEIPAGSAFQYRTPDYIKFQLPELQHALRVVQQAWFVIGENGAPEEPAEISNLKFNLAGAFYQMGIGGLHSCESKVAQFADAEHVILDRDVASYYPQIILNQKLFPKHLGADFLTVYESLVERRLKAKKEKNKVEAGMLKIVVNGSFGKFGNKWSTLYAPDLLLQVTISGQLTLLMLVERLVLNGFTVCSANTDGVLIKAKRSRRDEMNAVIAQWEKDTSFKTEETEYSAFYARDVNNYIGIKLDGGSKLKGAYSERGSALDSVLSKNPKSLICSDAVVAYLTKKTPIRQSVYNCRDLKRFVNVQHVTGGAVWLLTGDYLGKTVRYYYAKGMTGSLVRAENGYTVSDSEGARPCLKMPEEFPQDVDFEKYALESESILKDIGLN